MTIYALIHSCEILALTNVRVFHTSEEAHQAMRDYMQEIHERSSYQVYTSQDIATYLDEDEHFHLLKVQKLELSK